MIFFSLISSAQTDSSSIRGFYHPYKGTFFSEKIIPHPEKDEFTRYEVSSFINGLGIAVKSEFKYDQNQTEMNAAPTGIHSLSYGLMDTNGFVILPFIYKKLDYVKNCRTVDLLVSDEGDSLRLINLKGQELICLLKKSNTRDFKSYYTEFQTLSHVDGGLQNYLRVLYNSRFYLFDVPKRQFILPSQYKKERNVQIPESEQYQLVQLNGHFAVFSNVPYTLDYYDLKKGDAKFDLYGSNIKYLVYDMVRKTISDPMKLAGIVNDSLVYLGNDTKGWITNKVESPQNIFDFDRAEALPGHPWQMDFDNELSKYKDYLPYFIFSKNNLFGLANDEGDFLIPPVYQNIFAINPELFWVKSDSGWAICNKDHQLLTGFDFRGIEQMNERNFKNFMFYTRLNPDVIGKDFHSFAMAHSADIHLLACYGGLLQRFMDTHLYFSYFFTSRDSVMFAETSEGIISISICKNSIRTGKTPLDDMYIAPGYRCAYRQGEQFGFNPNDLRYDRVFIDLRPGVYSFYGTYSKRIFISDELFVKKKFVFGFLKYKQNRPYKLFRYNETLVPE